MPSAKSVADLPQRFLQRLSVELDERPSRGFVADTGCGFQPLSIQDPDPATICYPGELRQIFTNLIGNAFDAILQGGKILVRERLASHSKSGKKGIRITIADNGTGMTAKVKSHLFEAFHSTKGNNGTGLGLWINYGIAETICHGVGKRGGINYRTSTQDRVANATPFA